LQCIDGVVQIAVLAAKNFKFYAQHVVGFHLI
jgi:hypothetical protein